MNHIAELGQKLKQIPLSTLTEKEGIDLLNTYTYLRHTDISKEADGEICSEKLYAYRLLMGTFELSLRLLSGETVPEQDRITIKGVRKQIFPKTEGE